jgi:hypothetical protein
MLTPHPVTKMLQYPEIWVNQKEINDSEKEKENDVLLE